MDLAKRVSAKPWEALMAKTHPNALNKDYKGRKIMYCYLGELLGEASRKKPVPRLKFDKLPVQTPFSHAEIYSNIKHYMMKDARKCGWDE